MDQSLFARFARGSWYLARLHYLHPLVLIAVALSAFWLSSELDLLERFIHYSNDHEDWELDEFLIAFVAECVYLFFALYMQNRQLAREINRRREAEALAERQALHDALTGLPNRRQFHRELDFLLKQLHREARSRLAVLFIDVDNFKQINDQFGHHAGDEFLCEISRRLSRHLRDTDVLGRIAGDEFGVLLSGIQEPDDAGLVAQKLLAAVRKPVELAGHQYSGSLSIGIAVAPEDGANSEVLLDHADKAMYVVKNRGKNSIEYFSERLNAQALHQRSLLGHLRKAIANDELTLSFQAIVDANGALCRIEALLRWEHGTLGKVSPAEFIPLAERNGMMTGITRWVISAVVSQIRQWLDAGLGVPLIAINISAHDLADDDLPAFVRGQLRKWAISGSYLEFELTETALMTDVKLARKRILELNELGITMSIDDFGVAYSSLNQLSQMPVQTLKIDRMFLCNIHESERARMILNGLIALGKQLKLIIVAEGVETDFQVAHLREQQVDALQGFKYSIPSEPSTFAQTWLAAQDAAALDRGTQQMSTGAHAGK